MGIHTSRSQGGGLKAYRLPVSRVISNAVSLIDGLIAAADVNVAVVVRVIPDEELVVLQLELFQRRSVLQDNNQGCKHK